MIKIGFKNYNGVISNIYTGYKDLVDSINKHSVVEIISDVEKLKDADLLIHAPYTVNNDFRNKCRLTMWESNRVSRIQIFDCNKHDVLFVPNQFNANIFCGGGFNNKIEIFDPFISDDFVYGPFRNDNKLVIGIAFSNLSISRNDVKTAISCFLKAYEFKNDVELWIKCVGFENSYTTDSRVKVQNKEMNKSELISWYKNIDVMLCCSHGEGIGLMNLQAMATGRPLLTHKFSAMESYVNGYNSFVYEYKLDTPKNNSYAGLGKWAYINQDSLIEKLQYIYDNRNDIYNKSNYAMTDTVGYKESVSVCKLINTINKYV